jgi:hypothetical protein
MMWLILIVAIAIVGFYLRFFWAISTELKHVWRKRSTHRTWQPHVRHDLFRVDPNFGVKTLDRAASRIKDNF